MVMVIMVMVNYSIAILVWDILLRALGQIMLYVDGMQVMNRLKGVFGDANGVDDDDGCCVDDDDDGCGVADLNV